MNAPHLTIAGIIGSGAMALTSAFFRKNEPHPKPHLLNLTKIHIEYTITLSE
jgi:hypothetical protein